MAGQSGNWVITSGKYIERYVGGIFHNTTYIINIMKYFAIIFTLLFLVTCRSDTNAVENSFNTEIETYVSQYEKVMSEHIYFLKTSTLNNYRYIIYKSSKDSNDAAIGYVTFKYKSGKWATNTSDSISLINRTGSMIYSFGSSGNSSIKEYIIYGIVIDKRIQTVEIEFKDHSKKIIQVDINNSVFSDFVRAENICGIHGLDGAKNILYSSNDMCK